MRYIQPKNSIEESYKIGGEDQIIEEGRFGPIKIAVDSTGKDVAVKIVKKSIFETNSKKNKKTNVKSDDHVHILHKRLFKEVLILKSCSHPNIISFVDFYADKDYYYIIAEYNTGGDLFDLSTKRTFTLIEANLIYSQLICALEYLHHNLIVHRDIKLENILINPLDLKIKLIDFGFATYTKIGHMHSSHCGTLEYCAPEILSGQKYNAFKTDIWSSTMVLYVLIFGKYPWNVRSSAPKTLISQCICSYRYNLAYIKNIILKDFLSKIFVGPQYRMTIEQIKQHPWMKDKI